jgi:hypothetical protein
MAMLISGVSVVKIDGEEETDSARGSPRGLVISGQGLARTLISERHTIGSW